MLFATYSRIIATALVIVLVAACPVFAVPVLQNFEGQITQSLSITANSLSSARFTTTTNAITITGLRAYASSGFNISRMGFGIYSDNIGDPGTQLLDFGTMSPASTTPVAFSLTPSGTLTLVPNTVYHLRTNYVSGSPGWGGSGSGSNPVAQNGSGMINQDYRSTTDGGATWQSAIFRNQFFQLSGVVIVPEASTSALALSGLALGGVAVVRRKRIA